MSPRPGSWSPRTAALVGVALVAAATRVLPHPPSFTPVGALALFGGSHFASRRRALAVPLLAMAVSDLALTARYGMAAFTLLPWVYGAFGITVCLGRWLRPPNRSAPRVAIASLVAAGAGAATGDGGIGAVSEDAISALVNLGYGRGEAFGAVAQATRQLGAEAPLEAVITAGLKELSA